MSIHIVTQEEEYEGIVDIRGPYFTLLDAQVGAQEFAVMDSTDREWNVYVIERTRPPGEARATYRTNSQQQYEEAKAEDRKRFPPPKREPTPVYMPGHELSDELRSSL